MLPTTESEAAFNPFLNQRRQPFLKACLIDTSKIVPCVTLGVSLVVLVVMLCFITVAKTALEEVGESLADAGETVADMNTIIPEIRKSLKMLSTICEAPQFYSLCHGNN